MEKDERVGWSRAAQDDAEADSPPEVAAEAAQGHPPYRFVGPRRVVLLSVLSLAFASAVAFGMWWYVANPDLCSAGTLSRGANIHRALQLVALGGLVETILLLVTKRWRRLFAAVVLVGAATLALAVGLVAADSSTYVEGLTGFFIGPCQGTWTRHLAYLYVLWGAPLFVLIIQLTRLGLYARRSPSRFTSYG